MKEGFQVMVADLCIQLCITGGVYAAAIKSPGVSYQIAAMQAALPNAVAWGYGIRYNLKIFGSLALGMGKYSSFCKLYMVALVAVVALAVVAAIAITGQSDGLGFDTASNGCVFASSEQCLSVYNDIFAGDDGVQSTVKMLAFAAVAMNIFDVAKGGALATLDFNFLSKAAAIVFVLVFCPALLVARYSYGSAKAIYFAMYLPVVVLTVILVWRMWKKMSGFPEDVAPPKVTTNVSQASAPEHTWAVENGLNPLGSWGLADDASTKLSKLVVTMSLHPTEERRFVVEVDWIAPAPWCCISGTYEATYQRSNEKCFEFVDHSAEWTPHGIKMHNNDSLTLDWETKFGRQTAQMQRSVVPH